jgi:sulfate permease, SulP family
MTRAAVRPDLLAGLLLAAIAVPEQIATARLAGMPPEAGLFTFIAGTIGFAVFGTNRFLSAGADSTIAPIFAGGLAALAAKGSADYAELAGMLAVMVGVILITASVLRAGWIADMLSIPVTTGFLAGIAVHIVIGQLPSALGLADESGPPWQRLWRMSHALPAVNLHALGIAAAVLAITQVTERLAPKLPGALLALTAVSAAAMVFQLPVAVLGAVSPALPRPALPGEPAITILHLLPLALIVALVCMMQTAAVLRSYPSHAGGPRHVARDFGGIGFGCLIAGMTGGFPVNASPPRTAIVVAAGGQSQLAAVAAAVLTLVLLAGGGGLLASVPHAALAGILISVATRLFRLDEMLRIARRGGAEIWLVTAGAALILVFPIETGMFAAIVLSLLHSFTIVARPPCVELARAPGTTVWWPPHDEPGEQEPGVLVFAPAAPLNFTNASFVRARLMAAVERAAPRLLILEASGIIDIDYTAAVMLRDLIPALRQRGIEIAVARLSAQRARRQAERTGLLDALGRRFVFRSVEDAVRALRRETV